MSGRIVTRIVGGLGNQLFAYAAGRALAARRGLPLCVDARTGFQRDYFRRAFALDNFLIGADVASPWDSYEGGLGIVRRRIAREVNSRLPVRARWYVAEASGVSAANLNDVRRSHVYLEGYWQSEAYFADKADLIREDLRLARPVSERTRTIARAIASTGAIALHARVMYSQPNTQSARPDPSDKCLSPDYYYRAASRLASSVKDPHFFCFADHPEWIREHVRLEWPMTIIDHGRDDALAHEDLWLMSQCKHFVIAASSFSWWGAWLGRHPGKTVITPEPRRFGQQLVIPHGWIIE